MAGGGGKPQNIFKLNRGDDPKEVLNWRLWFAVGFLLNVALVYKYLSSHRFFHLGLWERQEVHSQIGSSRHFLTAARNR
jgi:hypothetical protein